MGASTWLQRSMNLWQKTRVAQRPNTKAIFTSKTTHHQAANHCLTIGPFIGLSFFLPKWGPIFGPLWQDLISFRALVRGQFCGPQSDPNWGHQGTPKRHLLHNLLGPFFVVLRAPGKPDCGWLIGGVCKSPLFQCMFWLLRDGARISLSWARASLSQALFKIAAWETHEHGKCRCSKFRGGPHSRTYPVKFDKPFRVVCRVAFCRIVCRGKFSPKP